jgi:hypothetical protein
MAGSTSTNDKLIFRRAYLLHARHLHKHNQTKRKKLRNSDGGQELSGEQSGRHTWVSGQELDSRQEFDGG